MEENELHLPGATMRFVEVGAERFVVELVAEPGFAPTAHVHRVHEEMFYVLDGEFAFLIGDQVMRLRTGAFVAVPSGTVHDFRNVGDSAGRLLVIATPGGLDEYFRSIAAHANAGSLTLETLDDLRRRYATEPLKMVWS